MWKSSNKVGEDRITAELLNSRNRRRIRQGWGLALQLAADLDSIAQNLFRQTKAFSRDKRVPRRRFGFMQASNSIELN